MRRTDIILYQPHVAVVAEASGLLHSEKLLPLLRAVCRSVCQSVCMSVSVSMSISATLFGWLCLWCQCV
jgi:hypothetical protein